MKFRVGLIGLGKQAKKYHLPGLESSENARLVAVCDIDQIKVDEISSAYKVKGYVSAKELLENESLDFVVIATPHDTHLEIVRIAALKGVHILKEKPFAKNLKEAIEILKIVKSNQIELMIILQRRFNSLHSRFFYYIKQIGKPSFIDMHYSIFAQDPHPAWRAKHEKSGGGCILDMGYHMIDLLMWYFGLPTSVYSNYSTISKDATDKEVEDSASIIFSYNNGFTGNMFLSRFCPPKTEFIRIIGQRGILEILKDKINLYDREGEVSECLVAHVPTDQFSASKQIDYFCKVLEGSKENISNPAINLNHMLFIESCYKSMKDRKPVNPKKLLLPKLPLISL